MLEKLQKQTFEQASTSHASEIGPEVGTFLPLHHSMSAVIAEKIQSMSTEEGVQQTLKVSSAEEALTVLKDNSLAVETPGGKTVVYLATLQEQRRELLALANELHTEVPAVIGTTVSEDESVIFLEQYWIPDRSRILSVDSSAAEVVYSELQEDTEETVDSERAAIIRSAAGLLEFFHDRSKGANELVAERVSLYLEKYPDEAQDAPDIARRIATALYASHYPYDQQEYEESLGLQELPPLDYERLQNFQKLTEHQQSHKSDAIKYFSESTRRQLEARYHETLGTEPAEELSDSDLLKIAISVPWLMVAESTRVGFFDQLDQEVEAWKKAFGYQVIASHVHPYFPSLFPELLQTIDDSQQMFNREGCERIIESVDRGALCESAVQFWEDSIDTLQTKCQRYSSAIEKYESLLKTDPEEAWKALDGEWEHDGLLSDMMFTASKGGGYKDPAHRAQFTLELFKDNVFNHESASRELQKNINWISQNRSRIETLPVKELTLFLLGGPERDSPRSHTFAESDKDADNATQFRLQGAEGTLLNEYVQIIENPFGLVHVASSATDPTSRFSTIGYTDQRSVEFHEYRVGHRVDNTFELLSGRFANRAKPLERLSYQTDTLPAAYAKHLHTDQVHLLLPLDSAKSTYADLPLTQQFLASLAVIPEARVGLNREVVVDTPVLTATVDPPTPLTAKEREAIRTKLLADSYSSSAAQDVMDFLDSLYTNVRVLSCKTDEARDEMRKREKLATRSDIYGEDEHLSSDHSRATLQAWCLDPSRPLSKIEDTISSIGFNLRESLKLLPDEARGWFLERYLSCSEASPRGDNDKLIKNLFSDNHLSRYSSEIYSEAKSELLKLGQKLKKVPSSFENLYFDYVRNTHVGRMQLNNISETLVAMFRVVNSIGPETVGAEATRNAVRGALLESPLYGPDWGVDVIPPLLSTLRKSPSRQEFRAEIAQLEDRLRVIKGKNQLYGTQGFLNLDGKWTACPIENPDGIERRRKRMGLIPMAEFLNQIEQADFSGVDEGARMESYTQLTKKQRSW